MKITSRMSQRGTARKLAMAFLAFAAVFSAVEPALARPDARAMTCAQVQAQIERQGGVVFTTGQYTFERYVKNRNFCQHGEVLKNETIVTRDTNRCLVRKCIEFSPFFYD